MAINIGQRFVRRHDAARTSTANTTAADITYDTAVLLEGGYTYNGPDVEVDTAGLYFFAYDLGQVDLASTRAVGTLIPRINGSTDLTRFRASHRYLRSSGGSQEGASIGMCILDLAANDDVRVRNPGALAPTDAVGNYGTNSGAGGGMQLVRLPDTNFTHVERTVDAAEVGVSNINTTRPWLVSSGTWTKITYDDEVRDDDALYSGSGGDVTLAADTKYMIVWGATGYSTDASRHAYITRLSIDGTIRQSGSGYQRNTASQGPPMCGVYLHETGGSTETLFLEATQETEGGDAGTGQIADAYIQVIELPSSAEWIHADNSTTDSLATALAGLTTWYDTPLSATFRADGDSNLSLDSGNDAIQNDSGDSLPILAVGWHRWDRDAGGSGNRKNPWSRWDNGGASVYYGVSGAFSRGAQSNDDTWQAHYCSAVAMDLANGADLSFQCNDEANAANSDMGIYASTSRHFLGVQVLNLDTLDVGGPTVIEADGSSTGTADDSVAGAALWNSGASSAGLATTAIAAAAIWLGVAGAADGSAIASADSANVISGDASSVSASVVSGVGSYALAANGASGGVATVSGVGGSLAVSDGASAGVAVATGESSAPSLADGDSTGTSVSTGVATSLTLATGSISGTSSVSAVGVSLSLADGDSTGTATAAAIGEDAASGFSEADADSAGSATTTGVSGATASAPGSSVGVATATGIAGWTGASVAVSVGVSAASAVGEIVAEHSLAPSYRVASVIAETRVAEVGDQA